MRELLFKNLTSQDHRKRDIFVEEIREKDGVLAKTTRRCLYFIRETIPINSPADFKKIAEEKYNKGEHKRHFYVLKERDTKSGVDKLLCKVAGTFYAMVNDYLYCIVFIHTFKICFESVKGT